jgi:hypothetical protein
MTPFVPFGATFRAGVSVGLGDVNGDGTLDLIVGPGKGPAKKVTAYNLINFAVIKAAAPFGASYTGGASVAGRR